MTLLHNVRAAVDASGDIRLDINMCCGQKTLAHTLISGHLHNPQGLLLLLLFKNTQQ